MTGRKLKILGIGGTTRAGSSSEKALAISLRAAAEAGADTVMISGSDLVLPMYSPDVRDRTDEARRLVAAFGECDGIIVSSAAYHGSISGLIKNALDYVEDLREGKRVYFDGVAAGLIACGGGWQATGQTLAALRAIAHALRAWPTPLGAMLNTSAKLFDEDGACTDLSARFQLETIGRQVVEFAQMASVYRTRPPVRF
jgi:FMN reductase